MKAPLTAIFILNILLIVSPCAAQWKDGDTQTLLQLEEKEKWDQALIYAQDFSGQDKLLKAHIEHLVATARILSLADKFRQKNLPAQAVEILKSQRKTLLTGSSALDTHLLIALAEKINLLEAPRITAVRNEMEMRLKQASKLEAEGNYVEANKILEHILKQSAENLPEDIRVQADKQKLRNELRILALTHQRIKTQLDTAAAFKNKKKFDDALKLLDNILATPASDINSSQKNQAHILKLQTEMARLQASKPDFVQRLKDTLFEGGENLAETLIYLLAVIALYFALKQLWNLLRPKSAAMEIALQDQTAATGDAVSVNTALSQELDQTLRRLVKGDAESADLGGLMDLDASGLPSAPQPSGGFETFASHIDTTPVTIGPFSLSPRQLILYLSLLFRPRYAYTLSGTLTKDNNDFVLSLKKQAYPGGHGSERLFKSRAQTRALAVQQIATQLLVSLAESKVTDDWRSLQAYMQAEQEMAKEIVTVNAKQRTGYLCDAQTALQTALLIDPANWLARYRLASVLRKLGQNLAAKQQFDYVAWMLCSNEILQNRHLATYVENSPLFPCLLIHNRAVCEAKIGAIEAKEGKLDATVASIETFTFLVSTIKQLTKFDNLKAECDSIIKCGPTPKAAKVPGDVKKMVQHFLNNLYADGARPLSETTTHELLMLIRAARTAAFSDWLEYELNKYQYSLSANADLVNRIFQWINRNEDWFYVQRFELKTSSWSTYALAHATTQNARGRASYLMKDWRSAQNFLQWAAGYHLPANFPEPYINLAALYLRRQAYISTRWMELAETNLNKALEVSPDSKKGRYLLGKLYYFRRHEDKQWQDKALEEFAKAGSDSWSLYRAADILVERNDLMAAAKKLKTSIDLANSVDWRYRLYLSTVLKLAKTNQATPHQILEARQAAIKLGKEGYRKRLREFGTEAAAELQRLSAQR